MGEKRKPNQTLIELRINHGLSIRRLAGLSGVSAPTIRLAERGHVPRPQIQFEIARQFGKVPTDIWPLATQKELIRLG